MSDNTTRDRSSKSIDKVYQFVKMYIHENALSPSVRDICRGVGLKSTSSVHTYLKKLDEMGLINYRPGMRRAIILRQEESADGEFIRDSGAVRIPYLGKITAGQPIYAHEDYSDGLYVSKSIIGSDDCFLLKVKGTSMINAHIMDGDYIIIRKQSFCEEGDIIAALIDDEATVKRYGIQDGKPYLFPENDLFSPIPFDKEGCRILGKVVGLHRYNI